MILNQHTETTVLLIPDVLPINIIEKRVSFDFIDAVKPFIGISAPSER